MMIAAVFRKMFVNKLGDTLEGGTLVDFLRVGSKLVFGTGPRLWLKISFLGIIMQSIADTVAMPVGWRCACVSCTPSRTSGPPGGVAIQFDICRVALVNVHDPLRLHLVMRLQYLQYVHRQLRRHARV